MPRPMLPITSVASANSSPPNAPVFVVQFDPDTGVSKFKHQGSYPVGTAINAIVERLFKEGIIGAGTFFVGEINHVPIPHPVGQLITVKDDGSVAVGIQQSGLLTSWPPRRRRDA